MFVSTAFMEAHSLCQGYLELQEMLLDILDVSDAINLGEQVYGQFLLRKKQKNFFRKLKKFYENQVRSSTAWAHTCMLND